jgi:hypothetical protein
MARGLITSLISGLGAPLATALANRFLVAPFLKEQEQELQRQKMVDNPIEYQQKGFNLVNSLAPGDVFNAQTGAPDFNVLNRRIEIPGYEGGKEFQQYQTGARLQALTPTEIALQQRHGNLLGAQEQKALAETKEVGALTPAKINLMQQQALHSAASAFLGNEQAKELAGSMASKINLQQAQANLAQANTDFLKSGDKASWQKAGMDHYAKINEELMKSPTFMMDKTPEERTQAANQIAASTISGMMNLFNKGANITQPVQKQGIAQPMYWTQPGFMPPKQ